MTEIARLLKLSDDRRRMLQVSELRFKLPKSQLRDLKSRLYDDGVSMTVFIRAVVEGYLSRNPALLALIDDVQRSTQRAPRKQPLPNVREVAEIYALLGGGIMKPDEP